jgi:cytidylate kinase
VSALIIAIDGPGGTGKSTVSRAVADHLDLPHLDTGAFYRAATLAAVRTSSDLTAAPAIERIVRQLDFSQENGRMYLDGEDVSEEIRGDTVTAHVSLISAHPEIRALLVGFQREWVARHDQRAVVEGRDIGTVVFPEANVKIYLDARPEVRAERRAKQAGIDPDEVINDLERRDRLDSGRVASPMAVADDAIVVDTSEMTFEEVVAHIASIVEAKSA